MAALRGHADIHRASILHEGVSSASAPVCGVKHCHCRKTHTNPRHADGVCRHASYGSAPVHGIQRPHAHHEAGAELLSISVQRPLRRPLVLQGQH